MAAMPYRSLIAVPRGAVDSRPRPPERGVALIHLDRPLDRLQGLLLPSRPVVYEGECLEVPGKGLQGEGLAGEADGFLELFVLRGVGPRQPIERGIGSRV